MRRRLLASVLLASTTVALGVAAPPVLAAQERHHPAKPVSLAYLGETEVPNALAYEGTTVGGLSAISWVPGSGGSTGSGAGASTGKYLLISDDRSAIDPARFYTATVSTAKGKVAFRLTATAALKQPDGSTFPKTSADGTVIAPDPEGLAVDPRGGGFAWSSEGERVLSPLTLGDPAVRLATSGGTTKRVLPLAPQLHMNAQEVGPRRNQTLEGLSYTPDGKALWAAMEDPLYQDGADPSPSAGADVRFTRIDTRTGLPVAQYAYPLSKLFEAGPTGSTNGVSDVAALADGRLLVLERAFTTRNRIRIFLADPSRATDVLGRDALGAAPVTTMRTHLLVDLAAVKGLPRIDNVEGITLGPRLPDGRRVLLLVSDDNFSATQVTQVIAFAAKGL